MVDSTIEIYIVSNLYFNLKAQNYNREYNQIVIDLICPEKYSRYANGKLPKIITFLSSFSCQRTPYH